MFEHIGDTIVAVSTPPGAAPRGVVRLSGPQAPAIAARIFQSAGPPLDSLRGNARVFGRLALVEGRFLLPAELFLFRAPRSYTREEVIEFHTAGAPAALGLLMERCIECGARCAEPGEFTARALYHGALSLPQVQGVAALIRARSDVQLRAAREWLGGGAAGELQRFRDELADVVARIEADIDFADEGISFVEPGEVCGLLDDMLQRIAELRAAARSTERFDSLPKVLLVGPANAGKSTLLNRLSGRQRAVCSPAEGTTRDLLSTIVTLPEGALELIDSAGTRPGGGESGEFSKNFFDRELRTADLVCHLLDLTRRPLAGQIIAAAATREGPVLWIANKVDVAGAGAVDEARAALRGAEPLVISAARGDGLDMLRAQLAAHLFKKSETLAQHRVAIGSVHASGLAEAALAVQRARAAAGAGDALAERAECIASDLRAALGAFDALLGAVTADDLLARIFSQFCIGK